MWAVGEFPLSLNNRIAKNRPADLKPAAVAEVYRDPFSGSCAALAGDAGDMGCTWMNPTSASMQSYQLVSAHSPNRLSIDLRPHHFQPLTTWAPTTPRTLSQPWRPHPQPHHRPPSQDPLKERRYSSTSRLAPSRQQEGCQP